ncbi:MAG: DUF1295 domain-containing protein [Planctomycetales bacterium]
MSPLLLSTLLLNLGTVLCLMALLWLVSLALRDASIVDPFWGAGFCAVAWLSLWCNWPVTGRGVFLTGLTTLWGLRLSFHLLRRNRNHGEDRRYRAMRAYHGTRFWWVSLFTVFGLQGLILWFIAYPIQVVMTNQSHPTLGWGDVLGTLLWCVGFLFETIADHQLHRFRGNPDNSDKVLKQGLWRYTRHPNYFGDFCVWWGIYLIAAAGGGWWTILSPLLMSMLLMKVSGVSLLEHDMNDRRPDYAAYRACTNAFFPGPPKRN